MEKPGTATELPPTTGEANVAVRRAPTQSAVANVKHPQRSNIPSVGNITQGPGSIAQVGENNQAIINPEVKPGKWVTSYEYNGVRHRQASGTFNADDGESAAFEEIIKRANAYDWIGVMVLCQDKIHNVPEWLTPYYFEAIAQACTGKREKAAEGLSLFIDKASDVFTFEDTVNRAKDLLQAIHEGRAIDCNK